MAFAGVSRFHALNIFPMASMSQLDPITFGNKTIYMSLNPPLSCTDTDTYVNIASDGRRAGERDASTPIIYVNARHCTKVMFLLLQSPFDGQVRSWKVCCNHSKSSALCLLSFVIKFSLCCSAELFVVLYEAFHSKIFTYSDFNVHLHGT